MAVGSYTVASYFSGFATTQISGDYSNYVLLDSGTETISSGGTFSEDEDWTTAPETGGVTFNITPTTDVPILAVRPRVDHTNTYSAASVPPFKQFKSGTTGWDYYRTFMTKEYGHKFDWRLYVPMSDSALEPPGDYGMRFFDEGGSSITFDSRFLENNTIMEIVDTIKTPGWFINNGGRSLKFFYAENHIAVGTIWDSAFYVYSSVINGDLGSTSDSEYAPSGLVTFQTSFMDVAALAWAHHGNTNSDGIDMEDLIHPTTIIDGDGYINVPRTEYIGLTHCNFMKHRNTAGGNWPQTATDGIALYKQTIAVIKP